MVYTSRAESLACYFNEQNPSYSVGSLGSYGNRPNRPAQRNNCALSWKAQRKPSWVELGRHCSRWRRQREQLQRYPHRPPSAALSAFRRSPPRPPFTAWPPWHPPRCPSATIFYCPVRLPSHDGWSLAISVANNVLVVILEGYPTYLLTESNSCLIVFLKK